jgi:hypothetical protein
LNEVESIEIYHVKDPASEKEKVIATWEHAVAKKSGNHFSVEGDSRSFVCMGHNQVMDMLFSEDDTNYSHFTPLSEIFADIKIITGARELPLC